MGLYEFLGAQTGKPSGLFGRILGHSMAWGHKPVTKWAIGLMDIQPTDHVLDVGCGSGLAIKLIAREDAEKWPGCRGGFETRPYKTETTTIGIIQQHSRCGGRRELVAFFRTL